MKRSPLTPLFFNIFELIITFSALFYLCILLFVQIYQNSELQALIPALGLGVRGMEFDLDQLRYHRIVIMTDADVDGAHIRLLLLTFLYRYQRDLIAKGYIYIACPPLYKATWRNRSKSPVSGNEKYFYDQ